MYGLSTVHYPFQTIHNDDFPQSDSASPSSSYPSSSTGSPCLRPSISKVPTHYAPYGFSGDGWGQLLLPIPSNEDPYKFLQKIQDEWERQSALIASQRGKREGSSRVRMTSPCLSSGRIDEDEVGKWECFLKLPKEVWNDIAQYLCDDGFGYSLACSESTIAYRERTSSMSDHFDVVGQLRKLSTHWFVRYSTQHRYSNHYHRSIHSCKQ